MSVLFRMELSVNPLDAAKRLTYDVLCWDSLTVALWASEQCCSILFGVYCRVLFVFFSFGRLPSRRVSLLGPARQHRQASRGGPQSAGVQAFGFGGLRFRV